MSSYHRGTIHCQQQQQSKFRPPSHQTSYHDLRFASRQQQQQLVSSPLDSQTTTDQFGFQLPNHLPATQILDRSRIKCANHRCGTGSKVRSVSIFDNQKETIYFKI